MARQFLGILFLLIATYNLYASDSDPKIIFHNAEILNENTSRIPFKLIGHLIVVEAELLGEKGNFIIDTGSETLILNEVHFPTKFWQKKKKTTTNGVLSVVDNPVEKSLEVFKLHNLNLKNLKADVINLSHIEKNKKMNLLGIIGYSVLKDYELFIDLHLNQITLNRIDKSGNRIDKRVYLEKITDTIEFKLKKHSIILDCYVGDEKVKFALDTGAEYNQLNKSSKKKILKNFISIRRLFVLGASDKKIEVLVGKLRKVNLENRIYLGPMNTILTNFSKMNDAYGTRLDGVLGYEFLRQNRIIINYKKQKMYFVAHPNLKN
ncbi:pepsin/retropepsin-like aspartic protease family protein [Urechidicola croceus]|uniref:Peptidase A2 domain-containing protein n=1 Tax=Urechidicola croceus TaxID=1850246 RepID=A0A1D8P7N5_9FLAO|nr:hypothetical protein [Urechidicola croceus]AOW20585.1 hypothetical protein LPB138_07790 [Urechidicola croceus]